MLPMGHPEEDGAPLYRWPACENIFNVDIILTHPIHILPLPSCSLVTEAWGIAAPVSSDSDPDKDARCADDGRQPPTNSDTNFRLESE